MKKISVEELRKIQLEILASVDEFCRKNDISYSLAYGSLLGAVRHGGYIPWDDDIDIAMTRNDYERFLSSYVDETGRYEIHNARKDRNVNIFFTKVSDNRTLVVEDGNSENLGISIDVFPIDPLEDTLEDSKKYLDSYKFIVNIMIIKNRGIGAVKTLSKKIAMALLKGICLFVDKHRAAILFDKRINAHKNKTAKFSSMIIDIDYKQIMESKVWKEYAPISFEGHSFMAVKDTDTYLKHTFGDYMKLPPKEQQVPKHDFEAIYWKD